MLFKKGLKLEKSVIGGSKQVLVKVVLFQLRGHGHLQNDTMLNYFPDFKAIYKSYQMGFDLSLNYFGKILKIKEKSFLFCEGAHSGGLQRGAFGKLFQR